MEKLVVVVFDLLGPIPWITESLATTEKKEAEKAKKEPTATPRESAKAIIQNPCAKAKKKAKTPTSTTNKYKLIGELQTPVHEGWEPREF